jgi:two-component system nitrogen regulation response regulator GlnG
MPTQGLEHIIREHLREFFAAHSSGQLPAPGLYDRMMPLMEKPLIESTLRACAGNQLKAARVLGINRNTLRKKLHTLGIAPAEEV